MQKCRFGLLARFEQGLISSSWMDLIGFGTPGEKRFRLQLTSWKNESREGIERAESHGVQSNECKGQMHHPYFQRKKLEIRKTDTLEIKSQGRQSWLEFKAGRPDSRDDAPATTVTCENTVVRGAHVALLYGFKSQL